MEDREKTRKQDIFEAAARLFRDKGYSATSMRDLARAVKLKAPSLYNHIQSKTELLREICFANAKKFLEEMDKVEKMNASASEKLKALLRLHIRTALQDVTSVTSFNDEWRHLCEPDLSNFKALRRDYESRFQAILEQGIADGEFRKLEPTVMLYTLLSSVRWLYDWFIPGKKITAIQVENDLLCLLMEGVVNHS